MSVVPSFVRDHTRIGLLSTYPPRLCGIATYAHALARHLRHDGYDVGVAVVGGADHGVAASHVPSSLRAAADDLAACDVAVVQHEFGIYPGRDGVDVVDVLDVLAALQVPVIVTLHTVPLRPTPGQRAVLGALAERAERLVVMTGAARRRLVERYPVDDDRVVTIPHGATLADHAGSHGGIAALGPLLTWGLLGPGKGVEHVIDALSLLADVVDLPQYVVAGVTHPNVLARDGDTYRGSLRRRARMLGVDERVTFDSTYRDVGSLTRFVASSSVVVLPYDSRDQVTSGVLVDAIAAGRPVIATAFPHAVELLGSGAGIVVPHEDPAALAAAIRRVVTDRRCTDAMAAEARRLAPGFAWPAGARHYGDMVTELVGAHESATT